MTAMPIPFGHDTITVIRAARIEERGNEVPDWSNTTEHDIHGCSVQPMATEEVLFSGSGGGGGTARDAVVTRWKVYGPPEIDVTSLDRVRYRGLVLDVNGQVQAWPSPTGALDHVTFELRHVEG